MTAAAIVAEMTAAPEWATNKVGFVAHAWGSAVQSVQPRRYAPFPGTTKKWMEVTLALIAAADSPHITATSPMLELAARFGVAVSEA